ncbi:hypothetical protein K470DRAFT_262191 [Piedraia hortae CBS 480.64]|uniref:Uncharacterized protein n=1 Tax=Piedraia hortae CBS 480.64 TaxID=1314780 RepID=A0A6A7C7R6_9PEZI|nr:hypothetical protein K470DRAFT_262191 [Piedraia hortae CBS 480.64]
MMQSGEVQLRPWRPTTTSVGNFLLDTLPQDHHTQATVPRNHPSLDTLLDYSPIPPPPPLHIPPPAMVFGLRSRETSRKGSSSILREDSIRIEEERREPYSTAYQPSVERHPSAKHPPPSPSNTAKSSLRSFTLLPRDNASRDLAYFLRTTGPAKAGRDAPQKDALRFLKKYRKPSSNAVQAHDRLNGVLRDEGGLLQKMVVPRGVEERRTASGKKYLSLTPLVSSLAERSSNNEPFGIHDSTVSISFDSNEFLESYLSGLQAAREENPSPSRKSSTHLPLEEEKKLRIPDERVPDERVHDERFSKNKCPALRSHPVEKEVTALPRMNTPLELKHPSPRRIADPKILLDGVDPTGSVKSGSEEMGQVSGPRPPPKNALRAAPEKVKPLDTFHDPTVRATVTTECTGPIKRKTSSKFPYPSSREARTRQRKLRDRPSLDVRLRRKIAAPPESDERSAPLRQGRTVKTSHVPRPRSASARKIRGMPPTPSTSTASEKGFATPATTREDGRVEALERQNALLSAALVAMLRTNGMLNAEPLAAVLGGAEGLKPTAWEERIARRERGCLRYIKSSDIPLAISSPETAREEISTLLLQPENCYSVGLYIYSAHVYLALDYPDLATGEAYKALLLADAANDESDEYHSVATADGLHEEEYLPLVFKTLVFALKECGCRDAAREYAALARRRIPGIEIEDVNGPEDGWARREVYPWNEYEGDRLGDENLNDLNVMMRAVAPKLEVRTVELPRLDGDGGWMQLGVFAKVDIDKDEVVLKERSMLTANNRLHETLCDGCSAELSSRTETTGCDECDEVVFCSEECKERSWQAYHSAQCGSDSEAILKDVAPADAADALYTLLLVRVLCMALAQGRNPLQLREVRTLWGDFGINRRLPFSFEYAVRLPLHVLEKLDIDVFADRRFDVWIFNTLYAKFRGTASARLSRPASGPDVGAVHPAWCLANHSCDPNVTWQWAADIKLIARRPIRAGEEVLNHYCDVDLPVHERREWARGALGGNCRCARCCSELA